MALTQERLKSLLRYDRESGEFFWREDRGGRRTGTKAGCERRSYIVISIDDHVYRAHHLAWLYVMGELPTGFIDHRDLNKHNNVFANLRLATKSQNMANRGQQRNSASGLKGVWPYRAGQKYGKPWQAGIQKNGRKIHLGHFSTQEEAGAAYIAAAKRLFGEFARAA